MATNKDADQQTLNLLSAYFGFVPTYQELAKAYLELGQADAQPLPRATDTQRQRGPRHESADAQTRDWVAEAPAAAA